ncbi:MAG: hypothetical protein DIZ77_09575 [endosymbiont of Seepiophila jonesi]|uniref:Uncharacterized protein n=1 Tax=endosymbiont of Lamellibrachia luymesi TaxID=2200907 RepID=A0A370E090_9GAMM|nr:MAG: hypothetical protein DIZ77_09575 [endosymbiont of Seepiophila jonesi]RDH92779.1 MAG: hypothetical protein DIZ79_02445 [endosymbiont of Lamellibrachia luymesi]
MVFLLAYRLRQIFIPGASADLVSHFALVPLVWVPLGYFLSRFGAYSGLRVVAIPSYAWIVAKALGISLALLIGLLFLLKVQFVSRPLMVTFAALDILVLVGVGRSRFAEKNRSMTTS